MFVYGIRCSIEDVAKINVQDLTANYFMEHGILIFPRCSKPTYLEAHSKTIHPEFAETCKKVLECKGFEAIPIDRFEHPELSDEEADAIDIIQQLRPDEDIQWFFVNEVLTPI